MFEIITVSSLNLISGLLPPPVPPPSPYTNGHSVNFQLDKPNGNGNHISPHSLSPGSISGFFVNYYCHKNLFFEVSPIVSQHKKKLLFFVAFEAVKTYHN
jgi:hypothetical protein